MAVLGIGIDVAEIGRFRSVLSDGSGCRFIESTFSKKESAYCSAFADAAPHYAGLFAAKEATRKATGIFTTPLYDLEVLPDKAGKPELWIAGDRAPSVLISISHSGDTACAVALNQTV